MGLFMQPAIPYHILILTDNSIDFILFQFPKWSLMTTAGVYLKGTKAYLEVTWKRMTDKVQAHILN